MDWANEYLGIFLGSTAGWGGGAVNRGLGGGDGADYGWGRLFINATPSARRANF